MENEIGATDTFPKLLARNARVRGARPAFRHKDRGIWQSWSWAEVHDIVRAYPAGLAALGLKRGDTLAIIGANRPKLYWSFLAAQSLGAVPVPVYADAIAAATDSVAFDRLTDRDEMLAYLPLAWVGDYYLSYAQALVAGFCISCPESSTTIAENLREVGPSYYFAPPRIYENLLTATMVRMEDASAPKRLLFRRFTALARRWGEKILNRESVPLVARLGYAIGNLLVYGPLKNELGLTRVRLAYTAGEAIGPDLFSFFRSIGMNLKQFYGQTEAFLVLTAQPDGEIKPDSVGRVVPHVKVRLSDAGEVQFKSPGQFVRYLKDEARTEEALTEDGYVKTGDAGFFDKDGHLHIIDRAKDVGRLRSGALFAPKFIENKLKFFPNIREAVAFGHERDFVAVFLNIDLTSVGSWAERNGVTYASYQELAGDARVHDLLEEHVAEVNRALAAEPNLAGAQIRRFLVLHKELDADDGEVTRTQKIRRGLIGERYAQLVSALYSGADAVDVTTEVMFEDGRRGTLAARVKIRDVGGTPVVAEAPAGLAA